MGFFDSFRTGLGALGDFIGDLTGAAVQMAPTVIPILQSTGVLPQVQRSGGGAQSVYYPGGAQSSYQQPVNPNYAFNPAAAPRPTPFPTGAPTPWPTAPTGVIPMPAFSSQAGGFSPAGYQTAGLDLPFIDLQSPLVAQGAGGVGRLTSPWVPTMAGARAQPFVSTNPVSGKLTWFKPAGRPILWSGDLTACRRVSRIARRARTVSRKR